MSADMDNLSDIEIQRKLMQIGFPNTPVTETTRPILINILRKYIKKEKLKKGKVTNYVLYCNDNKNPARPIQERSKLLQNDCENNKNYVCENMSTLSNSKTEENMAQICTSRMYAPLPLLVPDYKKDSQPLNVSSKYQKPLLYLTDKSSSYLKLYGKSSNWNGSVVNRLLSFRDTSIQKKVMSKDGYSVHASKPLMKNGILKNMKTFDIKSFLKNPDVSQYLIPHILIASLLFFFAIISVLYTAKKFDISPVSQRDIKYTMCNVNDKDLRDQSQNIKCISEDLFNKAMYITKELFKYLNERARLHHCIGEEHNATLDMSEFKKAISSKINIQNGNLQKKMLATLYLIAQNPQWMIKTIASTYNSSEPIVSFELIEPKLPLKCLIFKKITRFFTVIGLLILIISACLMIYFLSVVYRVKQKESMLSTEQFIKDIINELMYRSSHSEKSEILVTQLQDKFLPVRKRSKLLNSWNNAIKIIEENDNRVLFGIIVRNGEQLRTLAWNTNLGNKDLGSSKKWQSSAFETTNKILNPPTSCLKIRHMFDATEIDEPNLRKLIIESIIEKVGSNCNISDVQLDTQTCCVYIRCASEADAGIVHNEINGWWFDKRLISIKFLRLERFLNRFPKSLSNSLYFKSSYAK